MKARRKVQSPFSSRPFLAKGLVSGFTARAKGKTAALDLPGSRALAADGSRGCGRSVSCITIINKFYI